MIQSMQEMRHLRKRRCLNLLIIDIMEKIFLLIIPAVLFFAGCTLWDKGEDTNQDTQAQNVVNENLNSEKVVNSPQSISEAADIEEENTVEENDPHSDWLTYENEEHEFNIKYPSEIDANFEERENMIDCQAKVSGNNGDFYVGYLLLRVEENSENLSITEWIDRNVDVNDVLIYEEYREIETAEAYSVKGADSIDDYGDFAGCHIFIKNPNNDKIIAVAFGQDHSVFDEYGEDFNGIVPEIVSTINF